MRTFIGAALLAAMLLTGSPALKAQVSVGIGIGAPPPPRVYASTSRTGTRLYLGGRLLVSRRWALRLAPGLLDLPALRRGSVGRTSLGGRPIL